jgi:hypothetical protein
MEEVDIVVLNTLQGLGAAVPASIAAFTPAQLYSAVRLCALAIDPENEHGSQNLAPALDPKALVSTHYRLADELAGFVCRIGRDLRYNHLMYPSERETRELLVWLTHQLPSDDAMPLSLSGLDGFRSGLRRSLKAWRAAPWVHPLVRSLTCRPLASPLLGPAPHLVAPIPPEPTALETPSFLPQSVAEAALAADAADTDLTRQIASLTAVLSSLQTSPFLAEDGPQAADAQARPAVSAEPKAVTSGAQVPAALSAQDDPVAALRATMRRVVKLQVQLREAGDQAKALLAEKDEVEGRHRAVGVAASVAAAATREDRAARAEKLRGKLHKAQARRAELDTQWTAARAERSAALAEVAEQLEAETQRRPLVSPEDLIAAIGRLERLDAAVAARKEAAEHQSRRAAAADDRAGLLERVEALQSTVRRQRREIVAAEAECVAHRTELAERTAAVEVAYAEAKALLATATGKRTPEAEEVRHLLLTCQAGFADLGAAVAAIGAERRRLNDLQREVSALERQRADSAAVLRDIEAIEREAGAE